MYEIVMVDGGGSELDPPADVLEALGFVLGPWRWGRGQGIGDGTLRVSLVGTTVPGTPVELATHRDAWASYTSGSPRIWAFWAVMSLPTCQPVNSARLA